MAEQPLVLFENNDEIVFVSATYKETGLPYDLSDKTVKMYMKPKPSTSDTSTRTTILTSDSGQIEITDAIAGLAIIFVPRTVLQRPLTNWYRVDVIDGGSIRTIAYGTLSVVDL